MWAYIYARGSKRVNKHWGETAAFVQYVQVMDKVIVARTLLHVISELHAESISKHNHELPGTSGRCKNI